MKLGIVTPVLTMLPRAHAAWEEDAGFDAVARIAVEADRLGYHHMTCSEHVAIPEDVAATRGARYWDPLATFGYLAAVTTSIRFATHVLVLGYHHPLAIAKRYGTLDQVTDGRVILGLGVGSLEPEFALLDAPFADRGARADDAMRALRASLGKRLPEYAGPYFQFSGMVIDPAARQATVPLWVGGRTARSLRRAVELGDGWAPFGLNTHELGEMIAAARATDAWQARSAPIELVLQTDRAWDPLGDPTDVRERFERLRDAGATALNLRFVHHTLDHYCEQLAAMADLV
jgi:probable F420-dependent oxidoreductase